MRIRLTLVAAALVLCSSTGCLAAKVMGVMAGGFAIGSAVGEHATYAGYRFACPEPGRAALVADAIAEQLGRTVTGSAEDGLYLFSPNPGNHHVLVERRADRCRASVLIEGHSLGPGILGKASVPAGEEDRIAEVVEARRAIEAVLGAREIPWTFARWELRHIPN